MSLSPTSSRRRVRLVPAVLAAVLSGAALAASPALAIQVEQVSRADGAAGASPIESYSAPSLVTDDGTTAYFGFEQQWGTWATATGLWRRDIVTNKTTQIVGGGQQGFAGLSTDGKVLGLWTNKRLVAADKNSSYDIYSYIAATGKIDLVSRWDGLTAAASGLTGTGFITADGKSALYTTSAGIARRVLATGKTVKVGDGNLNYGSWSASADGSVFSTQESKLVTPTGVVDIAIPDTYGSTAVVSPNGRYAVVTSTRASDGGLVGFWIDTTTGAKTTFDPASLGDQVRILGFTPDNRALIARSVGSSGNSFETIAITLPTAASVRQATYAAPIYALQNVATTGKFATLSGNGPSYIAAPDGATLPGGADLPSPGIYSVVYPGCRATGWPFYLPAQPSNLTGSSVGLAYLPTLTQLDLRLTTAGGTLIQATTVVPGGTGTWPTLPAGGGFKLSATAKYKDGRSNSETWTIPSPKDTCSIIL